MDVIDRQTRYFSMHANCYVISLIVIRTAVCRNSIITFLAVPYSLDEPYVLPQVKHGYC